MRIGLPLLLGTTLALGTALVAAADLENGKALKDKNCMSCHDDGVYTRKDRRITSLDALKNQVKRCELTLELKWFDEDVNDVTAYLNQAFYKF